LPTSGAPAFGTITLKRNLVLLTVDGPRLAAKTVDPKSFQGTSSFHYVFYDLGKDAAGNPALREVDSRVFPQTDDGKFDALEAYWHPEYTVLARESDVGPGITVAGKSGGQGLTGRFLGFGEGRLVFQRGDKVEMAGVAAGDPLSLKGLWSHNLASSTTLGRVVWVTGARVYGPIVGLELQVHLSGKQYPVEKLGTQVLAVWDTTTDTLLYELAGVKPEK
ncbi:MAG TPA: hypothetical protein VEI97_17040, partial [bacterium]|nr:hypothetical protein [bacterium]